MHGRRFATTALVTTVLASAAAHGFVTGRWSGGDATPVMPTVPMTVGEWVGKDIASEVKDPALANLTRQYAHARSGRAFTVSLTVGRAGLTSQHTPEYCYSGSGYEGSGTERRSVDMPGGQAAELLTSVFRKHTRDGEEVLRIFWGWSADGIWKAPKLDPRVAFLGKPRLYKLYVVAAGSPEAEPGRDPQLDDFLTSLIGSLNDALFAAR